MYQWFTKFLICMDLQIYGKKWCDYLHKRDHRKMVSFLLYSLLYSIAFRFSRIYFILSVGNSSIFYKFVGYDGY